MTWPVSPDTRRLRLGAPLVTEGGDVLPGVTVAYRTWGRLSATGANGVLVCHALTGSADVDAWWPDVLGPGRALDPDRDFIVCSNLLGGCYGTTGPTSLRPDGRRAWGREFPAITVRDMVRVQASLLDALGVTHLRLVVGGSMGGMQALEWAVMFPGLVGAVASIAASAKHSAWCVALSEAQRQAIAADPRWRDGDYTPDAPPDAGLAAARMVAMCTYRSHASFEQRFGRETAGPGGFAVERYLHHQGRKLVARFDANTYVCLTRAMDAHDVGRGRGGWRQALARTPARALVVSIDSDVLYPPVDQQAIADHLPHGRLETLSSPHGHDSFLIEGQAVNEILHRFREEAPRLDTGALQAAPTVSRPSWPRASPARSRGA